MSKVLIFDLGGVVLTDDGLYARQGKESGFSEAFGISEEAMESAWDVAWPEYRVGKITEEEFWNDYLTAAGATNPDVEKAKKLWRSNQKVIEKMPAEILARLKPENRLAALTNISKEWLDYKREEFGLDNYFETIISSGYAGVGKPKSEIYDLTLQELGIKGYEGTFIDNLERNLAPARRLNMNTILFTGQSALERELESRGVKFGQIESIK